MQTNKRVRPDGERNRIRRHKPKPDGPLGVPLDLFVGPSDNTHTPRYVAFGGEWGDDYLDGADFLYDVLSLLRRCHKERECDVVVWEGGDKVAAVMLADGRVILTTNDKAVAAVMLSDGRVLRPSADKPTQLAQPSSNGTTEKSDQ